MGVHWMRLAVTVIVLSLAAGCAAAPQATQPPATQALPTPTPFPPTPTAVPPTATPELPSRILFIGDSDAYWVDKHLKNLAASEDPPRVIETLGVISGGASLAQHWNLTLGPKAIKEGSWDVVVLNQDLRVHWSEIDKFYDYASKFDQEIKQIGAQTVLYMPQPWKTKADPPLAEDYAEVYGKLGEELGAKVAPAALAWQRSIQQRPDLELYARDGVHGNLHGAYLSLCVLYAALFGRSPVGLAYHLSDIPKGSQEYVLRHHFEGGMEYKAITEEDAAFLQRIAWETVQEYQAGQ